MVTGAALAPTSAAPGVSCSRACRARVVRRRGGAGAPDWEGTRAEVDVRVGGRYRLSMRDSPSAGSVVTVEFLADGERTTVVLTHDGIADERSRDQHAHGWAGCLDNLGTRVFGG